MKHVICLDVSTRDLFSDSVLDRKSILHYDMKRAFQELWPHKEFLSITDNSLFNVGTPVLKDRLEKLLWNEEVDLVIRNIHEPYIFIDICELNNGCLISLEGHMEGLI